MALGWASCTTMALGDTLKFRNCTRSPTEGLRTYSPIPVHNTATTKMLLLLTMCMIWSAWRTSDCKSDQRHCKTHGLDVGYAESLITSRMELSSDSLDDFRWLTSDQARNEVLITMSNESRWRASFSWVDIQPTNSTVLCVTGKSKTVLTRTWGFDHLRDIFPDAAQVLPATIWGPHLQWRRSGRTAELSGWRALPARIGPHSSLIAQHITCICSFIHSNTFNITVTWGQSSYEPNGEGSSPTFESVAQDFPAIPLREIGGRVESVPYIHAGLHYRGYHFCSFFSPIGFS